MLIKFPYLDGLINQLIKDKGEEALLNVAYLKRTADNINSAELVLQHNSIPLTDTHLYLPSITPFKRASARENASSIFYTLVWCSPDSNPRPPAPKADNPRSESELHVGAKVYKN